MIVYRWRTSWTSQILLILLAKSLMADRIQPSNNNRRHLEEWSREAQKGPVSMSRIENTIYIAFVGPNGLPHPLEHAQVVGVVLDDKNNAKISRPTGWNHHPRAFTIPKGNTNYRQEVTQAPPGPVMNLYEYVVPKCRLVTSNTLTIMEPHGKKKTYHYHESEPTKVSSDVWKALSSAYPPWSYGPPPTPAIRGPPQMESNHNDDDDEETPSETSARY